MVRRDKNHPSLVIWSVENEMRWALRTMPKAKEELPHLRRLFNELDATRPAYHEGDSGIWNEKQQPIISRHYGPACHGWGWWDHDRPLHAGEMGRWHYGSPYTALQWAGDEVYADYAAMSRSLAREAARIIELGRANEVSCLFVWNTSGLDNFRPSEARAFDWPEPNAPHAKPLAHLPYESEYAWWSAGSGYRPGPSFETIRHAQRPVALVVWEERTQAYADRELPHTVFLVNDLEHSVAGVLRIELQQGERLIWSDSLFVTVPAGGTHRSAWRVPLFGLPSGGRALLLTRFEGDSGGDELRRVLEIELPQSRTERFDLPPVGVWGKSRIVDWLAHHGVAAVSVDVGSAPDPAAYPIVVLGEHTVEPGSAMNRLLHDYVELGGRLLVLDQTHSFFPGLEVARMPTEMAHIRDAGHPLLRGIAEESLAFFGDDPFGLPSSDSWVTLYPYLKPQDQHLVRPIVDSSGGDFGTGGLTWAPLVEAQLGRGLVVASQLRLMDRLNDLPVAGRLLRNALHYLASAPTPASAAVAVAAPLCATWPEGLTEGRVITLQEGQIPTEPLTVLSGAQAPSLPMESWQAYLRAGNTLILWDLAPEAVGYWESVIGCPIALFAPEHDSYQLVRACPSPLLAGISNEDSCWLENWTYRRSQVKERIVDRLVEVHAGDALLTNATRSVLDVLLGDGKASEIDRMPTVSAYLTADPPRLGAGLLRIPVCAGQVLICQMRWKPAKPQLRRFLGLLLWNLGIAAGSDILAGPHTPTSGKCSEGYPESVRAVRDISADALNELLQMATRQVEYCSDNATFRSWPAWQSIVAPTGRIHAAQLEGTGTIYLGIELRSSEPRKLVETVGGLPNPDLQTFLHLVGGGRVSAWVNGKLLGTVTLSEEQTAQIADIDLEAGSNLILLAWEPDAPSASLGLRFENKDRRPEITFQFV